MQKMGTVRGLSEKTLPYPSPCKQLDPGYQKSLSLYKKLVSLPGVNHVFIESGLRHDLLVDEGSRAYLEAVCKQHVSGRMKVAPEHSSPHVLKLMNKPDFSVYEKFCKLYRSISKKLEKEQFLVNYFISAHPGCTLEDTLSLTLKLKELGIHPEQIQDFIPLPMTLAGAMYYTEKDPFTGRETVCCQNISMNEKCIAHSSNTKTRKTPRSSGKR